MTNEEFSKSIDKSHEVSRTLVAMSASARSDTLNAIASALAEMEEEVLAQNALDLAAAKEKGRPAPCLARLEITPEHYHRLMRTCLNVSVLPDPIGEEISRWIRPNGIEIVRTRVPIGVIGLPFEARPFVMIEAAILCVKTCNSLFAMGDTESRRTSEAIMKAIRKGCEAADYPEDAIQFAVSDTPELFRALAMASNKVDLVVPRGSQEFVNDLVEHSTVPVLKHMCGQCAAYVDKDADVEVAISIVLDSVDIEPYACTATNTVILHSKIALDFISALLAKNVRSRMRIEADDSAREFLPMEIGPEDHASPEASRLPILRVAVVKSIYEAIDRINSIGAHVSDVIVTNDSVAGDIFCSQVDSACLSVNASARFADGVEFGMGAEIGFSTDKIHARGPIGIMELTSSKYVVVGDGQLRG